MTALRLLGLALAAVLCWVIRTFIGPAEATIKPSERERVYGSDCTRDGCRGECHW